MLTRGATALSSASKLAAGVFFAIALGFASGPASAQNKAREAAAEKPAEAPQFPNEACLGCHGNEGFSGEGPNGKPRSLHVVKDRFEKSAHGSRQCVECHQDIREIPHEKAVRRVSCVTCHERMWESAKREGTTNEHARLGVVAEKIDGYMKSIHARPSRADQSYTNATCYDCHNAHYVFRPGSPGHTEWRQDLPNVCGKCHADQRNEYLDSVHGRMFMGGNLAAPVCADCHSPHELDRPRSDAIRLLVTRNCGSCHSENFTTYRGTYHGQITTLGYTYTATCFDCHGHHGIQRVSHPRSTVHPNNRLDTCRKCHANATQGFVSFQPHANTRDFERYPYMWIASKFMIALLTGVFAFFWTHSALWFYREYRDRREGKSRPHVKLDELPAHLRGKYFRRFRLGWRIAHLALIVSVMLLVLTGMSVFYSDTEWARAIMQALGGPRVAAVIHRVAAFTFAALFFGHIIYLAARIVRNWTVKDCFGPNSLVPSWKDLADAAAMFRWFLGRGPRPVFDRWTYWEKFDYWAVFWGMTIIGTSGLMLWFPAATASFLPGWVFNVATLVHGEEAFLAAVFLFTVHFFNNHFRPDKYPPPDIVMFTGAVSLEEFAREHTLEYRRLLESGELEKYLVDAPSRPMTLGSRILGITLIAIGLTLLTLVLTGFLRG